MIFYYIFIFLLLIIYHYLLLFDACSYVYLASGGLVWEPCFAGTSIATIDARLASKFARAAKGVRYPRTSSTRVLKHWRRTIVATPPASSEDVAEAAETKGEQETPQDSKFSPFIPKSSINGRRDVRRINRLRRLSNK